MEFTALVVAMMAMASGMCSVTAVAIRSYNSGEANPENPESI
jgi:hypothetical protein